MEGHETEVLKGTVETIRKYKPVFLVESSSWDIAAFLSEFGYDYYDYRNGKLHRKAYGVNTFLIHPDSTKNMSSDNLVYN